MKQTLTKGELLAHTKGEEAKIRSMIRDKQIKLLTNQDNDYSEEWWSPGKGAKMSSWSASKVLFVDPSSDYMDIFTLGKILSIYFPVWPMCFNKMLL